MLTRSRLWSHPFKSEWFHTVLRTPSCRPYSSGGRTPWGTSRSLVHEVTCSQLCVCVVRNEPWPGSESEKLSAVSNYKAFSPPPAPLHPWEWPQWGQSPCGLYRPISWKDVPCCPWFSKWKEVKVVSAATSAITIEKLRVMFAIHGLLEMLVSDNGSCFTGVELQ